MCFEINNNHVYLKSNQGVHKPDDNSVAEIHFCQISLVKRVAYSCRYGWLGQGLSSSVILKFLHSLLFNVQLMLCNTDTLLLNDFCYCCFSSALFGLGNFQVEYLFLDQFTFCSPYCAVPCFFSLALYYGLSRF